MTSRLRHEYPYDTHVGVVINRAKFDACTSSSFRGGKTDKQNCALYMRFCKFCSIEHKTLLTDYIEKELLLSILVGLSSKLVNNCSICR